jgi:hypothetical protein
VLNCPVFEMHSANPTKSPSTNGIASRGSKLFQMESNGHSVILKNVGINAGWLWLVIIGF